MPQRSFLTADSAQYQSSGGAVGTVAQLQPIRNAGLALKAARIKIYKQKGPASIGGQRFEWEHMLPHEVAEAMGIPYRDELVMAIPYEMHRGGVQGAGGGVTSTGSSQTAKDWRAHLVNLIKRGETEQAVQELVVDEMNAAWVTGSFTHQFSESLAAVVYFILNKQKITEGFANILLGIIFARAEKENVPIPLA